MPIRHNDPPWSSPSCFSQWRQSTNARRAAEVPTVGNGLRKFRLADLKDWQAA
jgi:hypothetical protein